MKLQAELGKPAAELTNVQCVTCHRGVAIPKQLVTIMTETATKEGINKALAQYQDLRKQYHGAQAYDFTDATGQVIKGAGNYDGQGSVAASYFENTRATVDALIVGSLDEETRQTSDKIAGRPS